ncbi:MAG: hypothetical protein K2X66_00140, partial [Cyanobacteria bacterium]|nr:hypothetical protein [Cyanobacteriota bacterium]
NPFTSGVKSLYLLRPQCLDQLYTAQPVQYHHEHFLKQPSALTFGAKQKDNPPSAEEIARFEAMKQEAKDKRQASPYLIQALFPLKGAQPQLKEIQGIEAKILETPGLQGLSATLSAKEEKAFLYLIALIDRLLEEPEEFRRAATIQAMLSQNRNELCNQRYKNMNLNEEDVMIVSASQNLRKKTPAELLENLRQRLKGIPEWSDSEASNNTLNALISETPLYEQMNAVNQFLDFKNSSVRMGALQFFGKLAGEKIHQFIHQYPQYQTLLQEILDTHLQASPSQSKFSWNAMVALHTLAQTGRDGGELTKSILPQYEKLLAYAKTEVNLHLAPQQAPYKPEEIDIYFSKHASEIFNALILLDDAPLRFKLTQGMKKFEKFIHTLKYLRKNPEIFSEHYALSRSKVYSPYEMTQFMEIASSFIQLKAVDALTLFLQNNQIKATQKSDKSTTKPIDMKAFGKFYLETFAKTLGISSTGISEDNIQVWNLDYMHALAEAYRTFDSDAKGTLRNVIQATLHQQFESFLIDPATEIGQANLKTQEVFKANQLNMDTWLHYPVKKIFHPLGHPLNAPSGTTTESTASLNASQLESHVTELSGEILKLMGSQKASIPSLINPTLRASLFQFVKGKGYQFNEQGQLTSTQATKMTLKPLTSFTSELVEFLEQKGVWSSAQGEAPDNTPNSTNKQQILTVHSHLQQLGEIFKNLGKASPSEANSASPLIIKTWDRNPGYDLFQGNYSQCCIALDQVNRSAILDYLTTQAVQMIEVKDAVSDKTIANSLLFWGKAPDGSVCLVADNIEIAAQYQGKPAENIREQLASYLKEYALAVRGVDTPILLGIHYNDVSTKDLVKETKTIQFIGHTPDQELYLDALKAGAWSEITNPHQGNFYTLAA